MAIQEQEKFLMATPPSTRIITVPTVVTCVRALLIPCIVVAFYSQRWQLGMILFFIALGTDVLDGFLARLLQQETTFGAFLDSAVDKILAFALYGSLLFIPIPFLQVPSWFCCFVLAREMIVVLGAAFLMCTIKKKVLEPSWWGKTTGAMQLFVVVVLGGSNQLLLQSLAALATFSTLGYIRSGVRKWSL